MYVTVIPACVNERGVGALSQGQISSRSVNMEDFVGTIRGSSSRSCSSWVHDLKDFLVVLLPFSVALESESELRLEAMLFKVFSMWKNVAQISRT